MRVDRMRPILAAVFTAVSALAVAQDSNPYERCLCVSEPAIYWNFTRHSFESVLGDLAPQKFSGRPEFRTDGPLAPEFPLFGSTNSALELDGRSWIPFDDPGDASVLDFKAGDPLAIEAWVRVNSIQDGQQIYIVGKGRTHRPGQPKDNQNYALRLRGIGGTANASFLYRSADVISAAADGQSQTTSGEYHRWNSQLGFEPDGRWHHVAVSYTFGSRSNPRIWIDGQVSDGFWDMGEKTHFHPPVVDNDQLWIGSSMGGNSGSSFTGGIDELAIFRRELSDREIAERFQTTRPTTAIAEISESDLPTTAVLFDIREAVRQDEPWERAGTRLTMQWQQAVAAVTALPNKYIPGALIGDRTNPAVLRMRCRLTTGNVTTSFLIRARSHATLRIDGQEIATLKQSTSASDGHEEVQELKAPLYESMHPLPAGDQEILATVTLTDGEHLVEFETLVGGKNMRSEIGETLIATGDPEHGFQLLSPLELSQGLDERSWRSWVHGQNLFLRKLNQAERTRQDIGVAEYWQRRHEFARQLVGAESVDADVIDQLITAELENRSIAPAPLADDLTFLRRLALNTVGVIPSQDEMEHFLASPAATRRSEAIEYYLADDRWADHWVAYWQDVLAENPGILKPELNNSGPFRWWIYESLLDNKPMDRFATELVMMRGSKLGGGPAGFAMATQNDVPMAERSLVLGAAFGGREMTCARCHDSPVNDVTQQQLFEFAAMLNRNSISLPSTSTVPKGPNGERPALITVSLEPGAVIAPTWPFRAADESQAAARNQWSSLLRNPADTREQAALHLTHPTQSRFAEVIVNRLWTQLFGRELSTAAEGVSDEDSVASRILHALARQHIASGYDLKSTARIILKTQAWQRAVVPTEASQVDPFAAQFAGQAERRLSAEQMVDSLYAAVGKSFDTEKLTLDQEGRRPETSFLNLGAPTRAWQFCSLANERDRPALALPRAQAVYDLLKVFGWRDSRPHTLSRRENEITALQPLILANGTAGHRLVQFSDGALATELAVQAASADELTRQLFRLVLTREPNSEELREFSDELAQGFDDRLIPGAAVLPQPTVVRDPVSWSNHLHPRATEIKQQLEIAARAGDPPSTQLRPEWRMIAEDVLWVLLNSPEFAFMP